MACTDACVGGVGGWAAATGGNTEIKKDGNTTTMNS